MSNIRSSSSDEAKRKLSLKKRIADKNFKETELANKMVEKAQIQREKFLNESGFWCNVDILDGVDESKSDRNLRFKGKLD